ncbi:helix-turn-helix domain-containing protein [Nonomuraea sp. NPDC048826]|uniref:helix-turn-helix domain-containing protein n=1 Tax=Nonomuraea sp. NPDC048826 TaxID=3364347 RepID=UPI00371297B4
MRELVGRVSALDTEAGAAVRVIAYFDRLVQAHAGLEAIVRGAAMLAGCPVLLSDPDRRLRIRVRADGVRGDAPSAPDPGWPMHLTGSGAAALWLERDGRPGPVDAIVLERAAAAARDVLDRTWGRGPARPPREDPALIELLLDAAAPPQARLIAARRLDLAGEVRVRAVAEEGGHARIEPDPAVTPGRTRDTGRTPRTTVQIRGATPTTTDRTRHIDPAPERSKHTRDAEPTPEAAGRIRGVEPTPETMGRTRHAEPDPVSATPTRGTGPTPKTTGPTSDTGPTPGTTGRTRDAGPEPASSARTRGAGPTPETRGRTQGDGAAEAAGRRRGGAVGEVDPSTTPGKRHGAGSGGAAGRRRGGTGGEVDPSTTPGKRHGAGSGGAAGRRRGGTGGEVDPSTTPGERHGAGSGGAEEKRRGAGSGGAVGRRRGVGPAVPVLELPESWRLARVALRLAAEGSPQDPGPREVFADELGGLLVLAAAAGPDSAAVPDVLALERAGSAAPSMLVTLYAIAHAPSLRAAAAELTVHHSTLQERVAHAEHLLGWDVRTPQGRLRLQLAFVLRRLARHPEQDSPPVGG